ncbi:MAG: hypothetical protein KIT84_31200 [Labilithrix sp.]|nr:hypothetical protein [Labilithrix sp.]
MTSGPRFHVQDRQANPPWLCTALTNADSGSSVFDNCEVSNSFTGWTGEVPPRVVRMVNTSHFAATRVAGIVSTILRQEADALDGNASDLGIVSSLTASTPVTIRTNSVCCFVSIQEEEACRVSDATLEDCINRGLCDTCTTSAAGEVRLRPSTPTALDDSAWKFSVAHEIGHAVQYRGMGRIDRPFTIGDPPNLVPPPECACDHVVGTNSLHCLQSLEDPSAAQSEGFPQYFASRAFNRPNESDCTFKYYKDFLDRTCMPGVPAAACEAYGAGLFRTAPPFSVSCLEPALWRNTHCFDDSVGADDVVTRLSVEYDWMSFFYRGSTQETVKFSTTDLFRIYLLTCGSSSCNGKNVGWDSCANCGAGGVPSGGLVQGAQTYFDTILRIPALTTTFSINGDIHGVSRSTQR